MLIRKLVAVVGYIIIAVGVLQVVLPRKMEAFAKDALTGGWIYLFGVLVLLMGLILSAAALQKRVRIRIYVLVFGLLLVLSGLFIIAAPGVAANVANSFYFKQSSTYRLAMTIAGGVVRIILGVLLVYAGMRPPTPRTPRLGSIVPIA